MKNLKTNKKPKNQNTKKQTNDAKIQQLSVSGDG